MPLFGTITRRRSCGENRVWSLRPAAAGRPSTEVLRPVLTAGKPALEASASAPLEKLTIGWSAIAGSQAPFWITKEAGLFEKNGLDVTMEAQDVGRASDIFPRLHARLSTPAAEPASDEPDERCP